MTARLSRRIEWRAPLGRSSIAGTFGTRRSAPAFSAPRAIRAFARVSSGGGDHCEISASAASMSSTSMPPLT